MSKEEIALVAVLLIIVAITLSILGKTMPSEDIPSKIPERERLGAEVRPIEGEPFVLEETDPATHIVVPVPAVRRADITITKELLAGMLKFPQSVKIVGVKDSTYLRDAFVVTVEGPGLPEFYALSNPDDKPKLSSPQYSSTYIPRTTLESW